MENTYFYTVAGKQHGPVSFEQLKLLAIHDELGRRDKVWRKGMKEWQRADSVAELFEDLPPEGNSEQRQLATQSPMDETQDPVMNRNDAVSQSPGRRRRFALASVAAFALCLLSVIGGAYAVHARHISAIKEQITALQAALNDNLRLGLAGMGRDSHGVNLIGDKATIRRYWGAALGEARQIAELASEMEGAEADFPLNNLYRRIKGSALGITVEPRGNPFPGANWDVYDLEAALEALGQLERIPHAVYNKQEAAVMMSFINQANSIAFKIGQSSPFPKTDGR
jgi:hypothetical protein